jgi:hypothetical protein
MESFESISWTQTMRDITKQSEAKNVNGIVEEEKEKWHIHIGLWRKITKLVTK